MNGGDHEPTREDPTAADDNLPWDGPLVGRKVGDFVIHERIDEGGYGVIHRATQIALSREVVLKILRWRGSEKDEKTQRFLREAQLASQLDHPYAGHIYAFGAEPDGLLWIAMELVRGTPLKALLKTQGSLSLARFVPLLEKICEVVYTAHQQGIVHRDIKPSNVMVLSRAGRLLPKLLDFGIARVVDEPDVHTIEPDSPEGDDEPATPVTTPRELFRIATPSGAGSSTLTRRGVSIGSPPYMAPEQWARAAQSDARADQYSLAILAYEAITGRRPFRAKTPNAHGSGPRLAIGAVVGVGVFA